MLPAALSPPPLNMHMDEVSERQEGLLLRLPERCFFLHFGAQASIMCHGEGPDMGV